MENMVTCTKRIYQIQMSNGIKMDVESEKPLSGATTAKLLEEDSDIGSFIENIKILDVKIPQEKATVHKKSLHKKKSKKGLKKAKKVRLKKIKHGTLEIVPKDQEVDSETDSETDSGVNSDITTPEKSNNKLTPCDRINKMITMEGEFTRLDYQKFMEEKGHKVSDYMGHGDIEDAVTLKLITPTGEKIGKGCKKYRIIDAMPVEQFMFRNILKNNKKKRKY